MDTPTMWILLAVSLLPLVSPQYMVGEERGWHVNQYPNPWYRWGDCNRDNRSAICDPDAVIPKQKADEIDRLIMAVNSDTRCPCYACVTNQKGYVIRVALMEDMQPLLDESETEGVMNHLKNVRLFAYLLTQRWKLTGQCNETLLIVYSRSDNVLYTMTGSQAQKLLTDDLIVEISVDVRPFFEDKETIADGLKEMIIRYRDVFKKTYDRQKAGETPYDRPSSRRNSAGFTELSPFLIISMVTMLMS